MKYQLSLLVAVPLTLALADSVGAEHRSGGGSSHRGTSITSARRPTTHVYSDYHLRYGTKFAHGYFYRGRNHTHWSHRYYNSRYGCWTYWDPCCRRYYYWCVPANCFYPVSYCPYGRYSWSGSTYRVESVPVAATPQEEVPAPRVEPAAPPTVAAPVVQPAVVVVVPPVTVIVR